MNQVHSKFRSKTILIKSENLISLSAQPGQPKITLPPVGHLLQALAINRPKSRPCPSLLSRPCTESVFLCPSYTSPWHESTLLNPVSSTRRPPILFLLSLNESIYPVARLHFRLQKYAS
jgi:hypothetical protein